ncbi:putative xyloglucan endotransglucosylase/hydrolase protein 32 [Acorus calamus]|uniref:Xyloglucan endotransglucosylase/hydrolase n=1 Tax=Acorus calamus TaxID=4465 RepID=A0AAV9E3Y9_ACOCL|nr:putative xyloglucan endotransglucosylase/hydrolase protein 32 [Acorus calamus]
MSLPLLLLLPLSLILIFTPTHSQPSPGYYPSSKFRTRGFYQGYHNLWGPNHQSVSRDQSSLTIWLDKTSGSGFKSTRPFSYQTAKRIRDTMTRFFVDDVPIRRYPRKNPYTFPMRPMWVYGSIWDASAWATDDGRFKADYRYQPFVARFTRFIIGGCSAYSRRRCRPFSMSPPGYRGLSPRQAAVMRWAQKHYMVYNYCQDSRRDHSLTPECRL